MCEQAAKRWRFMMSGNVTVSPVIDEDGEVMYMLVQTDEAATKCYSPQEVEKAVDIAMFHAQFDRYVFMH